MFLSTQPYKGTRDFYPDEMRVQNWIFDRMSQVAQSYGYQQYNGPMLEPFELYAAKTGEEIVNQQLYWLMDRGERKLAVRPEMTPTLARMVAGKIHELPKPIRWFSIPNLWRYERPQRGRLREHWQLNVDVLGGDRTLADAEVIALALDVVGSFGGLSSVQVRVNNRKLIDAFFSEKLGLSAEVALKTTKALDSRAKIGEEAYQKWLSDLGFSEQQKSEMEQFFRSSFEQIQTQMSGEGVQELQALFQALDESGVRSSVVFDPQILRGMDYYTGTVFEMYDQSPENRRAMFGGGRYDNLVGLFGNQKLSGVGFGMGDVTFTQFLETHSLLPKLESPIDVLVTLPKAEFRGVAERIAKSLRQAHFRVITPLSVDGFGAQLKLASKHQAKYAVLLGDAELKEGKVGVKNLIRGEQHSVLISELPQVLQRD
ncbi:MAG: histidine--tRNA ligase [Bdellovibrionia bacterium]